MYVLYSRSILQTRSSLYCRIRHTFITTDGSHAGSANLGPSVFLGFYCNFVKSGPFVIIFGIHGATDNTNKCCKFGYCKISTSGLI